MQYLEKLELYVLSVIEGRRQGRLARGVRGLLTGMSGLFSVGVQVRLLLYRFGILRPAMLGCQVISVGNITVGGTGKTPVVEVFARELARRGRKVAILSRGYKKRKPPLSKRIMGWINPRRRTGRVEPLIVSDGKRLLLDSATGGDEPFMLASNLREVAVIVGRDRVKSGRHAIRALGCDTLILDDGFQYLRLRHRLDVLLVDRTNPFGYGRMLPSGLLREPVRNIRRAGYIFITKSGDGDNTELRHQLRSLNPTAEISECRHCARHVQDVFTRERRPLSFLQGLPVAAVTGIASPEGFYHELEKRGARLVHRKRFADHHRYTQQELLNVINEGMAAGAQAVLTTEKDYVRFPLTDRSDLPVYFLRVEIEMTSGADAFHEWIDRICFR